MEAARRASALLAHELDGLLGGPAEVQQRRPGDDETGSIEALGWYEAAQATASIPVRSVEGVLGEFGSLSV